MNKIPLLLTVTILVSGGLALPVSAAIKCWTNSDGVRECGNVVPPEYAQQGHEELSRQGMIRDQQERARTPEEIAEAARQEELLAEEKRRRTEQAREDRILLATYSSVADIEIVRNERLRAIASSIRLAESRTESIQQDLNKRMQAAADAERAGNQPNDALLKDIESLRRQISDNNAYIAERQKDHDETASKYEADIERFKTLKSL